MTSSHAIWLLLGALGLAGCSGLPDQRLAQEAMARGDTGTAQQNYQQLADLGYVDAQVGLADIQLQSGDPAQLRAAEATYRQAAANSPRAAARLGRLLASKPGSTEAEQREAETLLKDAMAAGERNTVLPLTVLYVQHPQTFPEVNMQQQISQWRADGQPQAEMAQVLLYRAQGTYDQHLDDIERICAARVAVEDACYVELATVYQKRGQPEKQKALIARLQAAYRSGQVPPQRLDAVARVMTDPTLGPPDMESAKALLEPIAPSYPEAWVSLARLMYEAPEAADVDQMLDYLERGRAAGSPRAELLLGKLYYEGKLVPQDPAKAEQHLLKAAPSEPSADYYLGQIYRRGFLGEVEPDKALDHLLRAARSGHANADYALAQMFSQGRGVQTDLVNAYVFSQLAVQAGRPEAPELAAQVGQQLSPIQRTDAQKKLQEEQHFRGAGTMLRAAADGEMY
ncbi:alginate biosynthesis protein AlgK [Metapseudomonas resinovorans]|uniref:alginate biosynthesis TPR repeat lipoprotein AlgK n=1 Tax=Metapseudomonas resinovorans TaxID=53412 RepID=UPI0018FE3DC6|nr:alginate biosynthesis TPR repeat lipoprotein AlgK [Pseudomonas resinovorans]GLZ86302.1 alginate biosynthesis protein AlgK [Pseudomonas resinovorans]